MQISKEQAACNARHCSSVGKSLIRFSPTFMRFQQGILRHNAVWQGSDVCLTDLFLQIAEQQHHIFGISTRKLILRLHFYDPGILLGIHLGIVLGRSIITSACRYSRPGQLLSGSLPSPGETPGQHLSLRNASCAPSIYKRCTLAVAAGFSAGKHGSQRRRSLAAEPDGRHQRPRTKCVSLQSVACRVRLNACHD